MSNLNTLWALLDAYEKDLPFINKNSTVAIESPLYPGKTFEGKITYISDLVDEQLRTVKIRVEVDNAEGLLKPNMYIQGIIENNSENNNNLMIPDEAVQNLEGEKVVWCSNSLDQIRQKSSQTSNNASRTSTSHSRKVSESSPFITRLLW